MGVLLAIIIALDLAYGMLRDNSTAIKKPYSFSKVQLAFWFIIIASAFTSIIISVRGHEIPTLANSTLIILGIITGTLAAGRIIDVSDQSNPNINRTQNFDAQNFFLDILSDANGVSLHRFQCFVFNLIIGGWFIYHTLNNLGAAGKIDINTIMPDVSPNNLVLLGLSSGTYIALKTNENKPNTAPATAPVLPVIMPAPVQRISITPASATPATGVTNQPASPVQLVNTFIKDEASMMEG